MAETGKAGKGRDSDADPDVAVRRRREPEPALERRRQMGSGRLAGVGPDRVGAGGGARGRGGRPGRMAGERGLPDAHEQRNEYRQDRDELDRCLPGLGAHNSLAAARADL
jgi:hypothetical protein